MRVNPFQLVRGFRGDWNWIAIIIMKIFEKHTIVIFTVCIYSDYCGSTISTWGARNNAINMTTYRCNSLVNCLSNDRCNQTSDICDYELSLRVQTAWTQHANMSLCAVLWHCYRRSQSGQFTFNIKWHFSNTITTNHNESVQLIKKLKCTRELFLAVAVKVGW